MNFKREKKNKTTVLTAMFLFVFLFLGIGLRAQEVQKTEGWLESAFVEWTATKTIDSYKVFVSGTELEKQMIDPLLIRDYGSYFRADALGLTPGEYQFTIVPVKEGKEQTAINSEKVQVKAHDRSGFAFTGDFTPGAYNADGTLKSNAVVMYVTNKNKDKIAMYVNGASENPCVGLQEILYGYKKGKETRPLSLRIIGEVKLPAINEHGDMMIENSNNALCAITLEGVGNDATLNGWGVRLKNASNVEIRNLAVMNCSSEEGDNISLQQDNEYIWVHHCDYFYGHAGDDADQVKGDGALDCKKSTHITFSYNHFWDNGKCNLLGLSEDTTDGLYITYHHNWYDHSDSRHPRIRFYSAHVYNNYYDGNAKYGIGSTMGSSVFAEANYFRHCKYPFLTSMQGTEVFDKKTETNNYKDPLSLSGENGGVIKAYNNFIEAPKRFVAYGDANYPNATIDFDAYVTQSRDEILGADVKANYGKTSYNNFDTNSAVMYNYKADSPEKAKEKVMQLAGRMQGGDFKWQFDNAVDDKSSKVNQPLKDALMSYTTTLKAIPADTIQYEVRAAKEAAKAEDAPLVMPELKPITENVEHVFTSDGIASPFIFFNGSLSDSKGEIEYNGSTLNVCLKMESSTQIKFTTVSEAEVNLVFNADFAGSVKVDGKKYKAIGGKLSVKLSAGEHTILKGSSAYLYVMTITIL